MAKPLMVERAPLLFVVLMIAGLLMGAVAVGSIFTGTAGWGGWEYWVLILGSLCFIVGIAWMISYLNRVNRFYDLLSEESKAAFIRKLDDLEYLAWRLPSRFEAKLGERKRKLGIK